MAVRLGLTPLAYLWRYPYLPPAGSATLLRDMGAAGLEARIVKVASGGLDERHLWMDVAGYGAAERLERDMGRFGGVQVGSVLGEGGEFETLALDGPAPLWKGRLVVGEGSRRCVMGEGGVAFLEVGDVKVVEKEGGRSGVVRVPALLDEEWRESLDGVNIDELVDWGAREADDSVEGIGLTQPIAAHFESRDNVYFLNMTADGGAAGIAAQTADLCRQLEAKLSAFSISPRHIISTTILLRSMSDFAEMNDFYKRLFSFANPPARITIACGDLLPDSALVMFSAVATKSDLSERRGLHVQSLSYWAPANIGPYSQAVATPLTQINVSEGEVSASSRLVSIAGQIPLIPASMEMVRGPFELHATLALQHLWRIGRAMQVTWWVSAVAFITASSQSEASARAAIASHMWEQATNKKSSMDIENDDDDEDFDIGDLKLRQPWMQARQHRKSRSILPPLPDWSRVSRQRISERNSPPCFVAQVDGLPRAALVEWMSMGITLGAPSDQIESVNSYPRHQCIDSASGTRWSAHVAHSQDESEELLRHIEDNICGLEVVEAFVTIPTTAYVSEQLKELYAQVVPCRRLWGARGSAVLVLRCRWTGPSHQSDLRVDT